MNSEVIEDPRGDSHKDSHKSPNKSLNKNNIDIVLYHGYCYDGFGSAFIVWYYYKHKFGLERANQIEYTGCTYNSSNNGDLDKEFLTKMTGKNILMCDFSYKYNQLVQLIEVSNTFLILDHHKTAEEFLNEIPTHLKTFDMKRSGVGITWDYFFPGYQLPQFLAYIQERDLWTYRIPQTREFVAYFYEQPFDFQLWETYLNLNFLSEIILKGANWLQYQEILIKRAVDRSCYIIQKVMNQYSIVLYSNSLEFKSDIGNKLFTKYPFGDFSVVWSYDLYKNETQCSLRSTNERYDVSKIATSFGGGGHRNASGLAIPGATGCLPFERVDDHGILDLLISSIVNTIELKGKTLSYTLLKVTEIKSQWLEADYLDLIKRKMNVQLIVFQKPSEQITYNETTQEIKNINDYVVIYNEKTQKDPSIQLQLLVCANDHHLVISSEKEFSELFKQINNATNEIIHEYDADDITNEMDY